MWLHEQYMCPDTLYLDSRMLSTMDKRQDVTLQCAAVCGPLIQKSSAPPYPDNFSCRLDSGSVTQQRSLPHRFCDQLISVN